MKSSIKFETPALNWGAQPKSGEKYTVRGQKASLYEYNFAWALERARLEYIFQVDFLGGRSLAGGMVVDFLVKTVPLSTPCWINGDYWHSGAAWERDKLKQAMLYSLTSSECNRPITFWGQDTETKEAALAAVRRELT